MKHHFRYLLVDINGFTEKFDPQKLKFGQYIIHNNEYYQIKEFQEETIIAFSMKFINGDVNL